MKPSQVASTGISALSAQVIAGSTGTGLTAAGTTTANALVLVYENSYLSTVAAGSGVRLQTGEDGQTAWIYNGGANAVLVYPPTGGTLNDASTNVGVGLDAGKAMMVKYRNATSVTATADDITPALLTVEAIAGSDSSLGITGQAAAQGGAVAVVGGTSSTSGNAGGGITLTGGTPGATGAGGAVSAIAAAGGSTSGTGGAVNLTAGAGTAGNAAGGSVIATAGAKHGTGLDGGIFNRGRVFFKTPAPETAADTASLTDAQMLSGILVATPTAAAAYTVRTGTQLKAAIPATLAADDSFDLTIINIGGTGDDITLTAAADITIVGDAVVRPSADSGTEQAGQGTFRFRFTTGTTFIAYRIS